MIYKCPSLSRIPGGDRFKWGNNQIYLRFKPAFDILLSDRKKEGTSQGTFYRSVNGGVSSIYVEHDKQLTTANEWINYEEQIRRFIDEIGDRVKILIGYTGIGKTTLLRNALQMVDRDVYITAKELYIYISFHDGTMDMQNTFAAVHSVITKKIGLAVTKLTGNASANADFYRFIEETSPDTLDALDDIHRAAAETEEAYHRRKLEALKTQGSPYLYDCLRLLYTMDCAAQRFERVVFIYDDIESRDVVFHQPMISAAQAIHDYMKIDGRHTRCFYVKTLFVFRAYTTRQNQHRMEQAFRINPDTDYIIKENIPMIAQIFKSRFEEAIRRPECKFSDQNKDALQNAMDALLDYCDDNNRYDVDTVDIITDVTNRNIAASMDLFIRLLTYGVPPQKGSFGDSIEIDKIIPGALSDRKRALIYGSDSVYKDGSDRQFTNIMHISDAFPVRRSTELLGLYIIRYFEKHTNLYGINYKLDTDAIRDLTQILGSGTNADSIPSLAERLQKMIEKLFIGGALLHSIKDEEDIESTNAYERVYPQKEIGVKLYLSLRGKRLWTMLGEDSMLMEAYREDILVPDGVFHPELYASRTPYDVRERFSFCGQMMQPDRLLYLIEYIRYLFGFEKEYLCNAVPNINAYRDYFGDSFMVGHLLLGVSNSLKQLTRNNAPARGNSQLSYATVIQELKSLIAEITAYADNFNKDYSTDFHLSSQITNNITDAVTAEESKGRMQLKHLKG
ncbi:MAG: hypothetical protein LBR73_08660 [Oscillospiraceae bacterium]|jgi:hypothetical protein|nr:hypothetical protein [Oscillospiraceae bacterium]